MGESLDDELGGMTREELLVVARSRGAEIRALRAMREENRRVVVDAMVRLGLRSPFPSRDKFGCPSEAH